MSRTSNWNRLLAVPAVLVIALGGAVLTAGPASAAPGDPPVITSPLDGSTASSRTVVVTGTGSDGSEIFVFVTSGSPESQAPDQRVTVEDGGGWTAQLVFGDDADIEQMITAVQTDEASGLISNDSVTIQLPVVVAPVPAGSLTITSPVEGAALTSRSVTVLGTGPVGATVLIANYPGSGEVVTIGADGTWRTDYTVPIEAATAQTVRATGSDANGADLTPAEVSFTVPAALPAPVLTAPATGSVITGRLERIRQYSGVRVSISGTSLPNRLVELNVLPADEATLQANGGPSDSSYFFPVVTSAADGTFSTSIVLTAGNYAVSADIVDRVYTVEDGSENLSPLSNEVAFTVVEPAAPAAVLADTGAASTGSVAPAAALLLAGIVMVVANRRRSALS